MANGIQLDYDKDVAQIHPLPNQKMIVHFKRRGPGTPYDQLFDYNLYRVHPTKWYVRLDEYDIDIRNLTLKLKSKMIICIY